MNKKSPGRKKPGPSGGAGFLAGLAEVLDKLSELAETGRSLSQSGEFGSASGKELKGVYGFNVRVGLGGEEPKVEPFGNLKVNRGKAGVVVQEVREPAIDLMEEDDHLLIVAEMPGVGADDIKLQVDDDVLTIAAAAGDQRYRKEILLPRPCPRERMKLSCNNGIVKIRCPIAHKGD